MEKDDIRLEFLGTFTLKVLRLKRDKWQKFVAVEQNRNTIRDFFERLDICRVFISLNAGLQLVVTRDFAATFKNLSVYFVKKENVVINYENIQDIYLGNFVSSSMDAASRVAEVIRSMRTHEDDTKKVDAGPDVALEAHILKNELDVMKDRLKGRTFLPLPPNIDSVQDSKSHCVNSKLLHAFETAITDWRHQVALFLSKTSAQPILDGLNPLPKEEFAFWSDRLTNLEYIHKQLMNPMVLKMAVILKTTNSCFTPALRSIYEDVEEGLREAREIDACLKPLQKRLDDIEQMEYSLLPKFTKAMMHTLALIWANSEYYRHPERIIIILQEICNLYIDVTRNFLGPEEIMKGLEGDLEDSIPKMKMSITVIVTLKESYEQCKQDMFKYFKKGTPKHWDFPSQLVFTRLNAFLQRLKTIEEVYITSIEFLKLEKVLFHGTRGGALGASLVQIYEEFLGLLKMLAECSYDPIEISDKGFEVDFKEFQTRTTDYERRLGTIFCQAFDDCGFSESATKLFEMFGVLLERPLLYSLMFSKYKKLLEMFSLELDRIKLIYDAQMAELERCPNDPPIGKNMPPVAGQLKWAQELRDRLHIQMKSVKEVYLIDMSTEEGTFICQKYEEMMELLHRFCERVYARWSAKVDADCEFNLSKPLLLRNRDTNVLEVNFSDQLVAVLKEVKYLTILEQEAIPPCAAGIFDNRETFHIYNANLDIIVASYNQVQATLLPVEFALVEGELKNIDEELTCGETYLYWNGEGLREYIEKMRDTLQDLQSRIEQAKSNVKTMQVIIKDWLVSQMLERKGNKKEALLDLEGRLEALQKKYDSIRESGEKIHALMAENKGLFKADERSDPWIKYTDYIDAKVLDGLFKVIHMSLEFLVKNMCAEATYPLFEVSFALEESGNTEFHPSLTPEITDGFHVLVKTILHDIYTTAVLFPRISLTNTLNYMVELEETANLKDMRKAIMTHMLNTMQEAQDYHEVYQKYAYLWKDDQDQIMELFQTYGKVFTNDDIEAGRHENIPKSPPTLKEFKDMIDTFEVLYSEVKKLENTTMFQRWLQTDIRPFKHTLLELIRKWGWAFKQNLVNGVSNSLKDLEAFINEVKLGLNKIVVEGDRETLEEVMGHLYRVKERQTTTDTMFVPLKDTIEFLKELGEKLPEEVYSQLQDLPGHWTNLKKSASEVKTNLHPMQVQEGNMIKEMCRQFEKRQLDFREKFRQESFFLFSCTDPSVGIDQAQNTVTKFGTELEHLHNLASLFEVKVPSDKQLIACQKDIHLLRELWEIIHLVKGHMDDWRRTPWKDINVDDMVRDTKKYSKDIKGLDKDMKAWDAYTGLDSMVKNMVTSLRAVGDLQSPAIRDRHWQQLTMATKVSFIMSEETTLDDLLKLNLHKFEDEVIRIVDRAVKELGIEKVLRELNNTWRDVVFEYTPHGRTGTMLLKQDEVLVETLQDNQVQLQTVMTSKYIDYFLEEVSSWQQKLSIADSVISTWFHVQHTWSYLEFIFIGSEDIRSQLPEDCTRFHGIDVEFKELMADAVNTPKVIECTNKKGLLEKLEHLEARLTKCETALVEYLEVKKLAFPRFYFVSSADLLDILSNGNIPIQVTKHLSKLFDSISNLKFLLDENEKPLKQAKGMYSNENEYVEFDKECDCSGQVETWLNRVLERMVETLRVTFEDAVTSYEKKPREQWLFDHPAQIALAATQIWWTKEVGIALAKLEEGYENAMKDYFKKQVSQLNALITLLIGNLTKGDRQKIMTICTIDVHARDVVAKLITSKVDSGQAFMWQSQLRHRWDQERKHCFANICDAQFQYSYEYLGNTPRLVITPLTDRCYITLTQSLHLIMGGAPAGPAGTGKTETTKDLGKALGIMVYVFNCSEQMDYKSCGDIYKGLAQTGAWGCFDEFNRISVEVLSVIAVQVKCIQSGIKTKKKKIDFFGQNIKLIPTVGVFITMNPGYAGRAELPENLKALFRPCAMVVPDFELICEIMLVAEGFTEARILARKFITLYRLCKELLSKQDHYDWGLRAIKSVLVVAGSLKRGDPGRPEDQVLMRALRDFNIPKIVLDDKPVFMGLIGDLFPALDVPRKRDMDFEKTVKKSVLDLKLQAEDNFVLKVVQLEELLAVRHSVFIIGSAGCGKSQVMRSLNKTYQNMKRKPVIVDLDPKAVTCDELFGIINPATREWKDGLFSCVMREIAYITHDGPKWIVLDGDIDPMWIESLNTVMDDNKVLTLASNERIPLNPTMRLVFEIKDLRTATPATVSRAGILFINSADLGWSPVVTSWIEKRDIPAEKNYLLPMFEKYLPSCMEKLKFGLKQIIPIPEITLVQMLLYLLECLLLPDIVPPDSGKELYELYFVFACVWAFGSSMFQDQLIDYRMEFSKWWVSEFRTIKFPTEGTVFDYFINKESKQFTPWMERVPKFILNPEIPLQASLVHTAETVRIRYFMDELIERRRPVMLVGNAGSGKTVLMGDKLRSLAQDQYMIQSVPFNFYTTSAMLQAILEKPLEKKAGRNYGPPGNKNLIYFIDDMNMPEVDKYFTVAPHTLIRQHMDHSHWYDRQKLTLKDIRNCQYVACMNPTAGSFTIDSRLQRHFCVFAVSFPGQDALFNIYNSIFSQHLDTGFSLALKDFCPEFVNSTLVFHQKISTTFLPTAVKFHYVFNLRDLSNIFQGLLFSSPECVTNTSDLIRIWLHECSRVYGDRLRDEKDIELFENIQEEMCKLCFEDKDLATLLEKPNIYCHFTQGLGDPMYFPIPDWKLLTKLLTEALDSYNEVNAVMNLVLFEDAMAHICRINRILESPRGNALLVGVGGSGKQSLSRLAASISNLEVFQITLRKGYGIADLKLDLNALYIKAGVKNIGTVFLMTDSQVAEEGFLVLINDLLASGEIPGLFQNDEVENIIGSMMSEIKSTGLPETRDNCWKFFIDRVRKQLKVVLCFSPVGSTLRDRARKFPAIVNCTSIDWFHEWPKEALVSVSTRFLSETEGIQPELKDSLSQFMAYVHKTVNDMSKWYLLSDRCYNYTTPKTFLEQIKLYQNLLGVKRSELLAKMDRLVQGLVKLENTAVQVEDLNDKLAVQKVELKQKNEDASKLIQVVTTESDKVAKEKAIADEEDLKVQAIAKSVGEKQKSCEADLAKAEPALMAAQEALNTLNKNNLTELKSFASPPEAVVNVTAAVMVLLAPNGKIPKDKSWKAAKNMMAKVDAFLDNLVHYNKENIHDACMKAFDPFKKDPQFEPNFIRAKSIAAAGLCSWCINIVTFYEVFCDVKPKRMALDQANAELAAAKEKKAAIAVKIKELNENLAKLTAEFEKAKDGKLKCQMEADATNKTISLANRLVGGLASENVRWSELVAQLKTQETTLCGDVMLISAFVSYVGYFTKKYRTDLMDKYWLPFLNELKVPVPITEGLDPLTLLTDDVDIAAWSNQGLPTDRMSVENATILCNTERWPLIVDAQLRGIKWIKNKYGESLRIIRLGQKGYLDKIENAVSCGDVLLIENIGESVEPVLDPLLGRNTIKKGKYICIGDKEVEYHPNFRLILHTKLFNPHYKPEMQAQCTLINFLVTRDGLEDQLLAAVVAKERPDLEEQKAELTREQNSFKITLKQLEDTLLAHISAASGNFLGDTALVESLETTKLTATEIEQKVIEAKIIEAEINQARENYRPASIRAAVLFFILNDLKKINPIYQFSLKAFTKVFEGAIMRTEPAEEVNVRVENLINEITFAVFMYTNRCLFERDKLTFVALIAFQILVKDKLINPSELDFLLRYPFKVGLVSPVDFLSNQGWGGVKALVEMDEFKDLDTDIESLAPRWKKFVESEASEKEIFPQEWKKKSGIQKLCMMRCMRPDRMSYAIRNFVEATLGTKYVDGRSVEFAMSYEESSSSTPMFFILSPGVDPLTDVEALGKKLGFTIDNGKFHNVSLGQGQEVVAEDALDMAASKGHWVILQNIHLVAKWLSSLDKRVEMYSIESHTDYRVYMSAEPAPTPESHIIPQGLLENSIKITNEPPTGIHANLHRALDLFDQNTLEMCSKESEFQVILFAMCYFHAVVAERRKFGAQGWNRSYPFNNGDLTISIDVLYNYLEANSDVPWDDLRYLFGEIMYGGHITDDWDRRLCRTYLQEYMQPEMLDEEMELVQGFPVPRNLDYKGYHLYIDEMLPPESPYLYGLHPNAEIGILTVTSEKLFRTLLELQPKEGVSAGGGGVSREEMVKEILEDILDKLPEEFNMLEIIARANVKTPFIIVVFQECERMNILTKEILRSLKELNLGLKGELTITTDMEELGNSLFLDSVPESWEKLAYPSLMGLGDWYADLLLRIKELEAWTADFSMPPAVWLSGFFNPQSFLTAIMQSTARKNEWPLDKMCLSVEVTKKNREDMTGAPRDGAYVHGLFMEGARWDTQTGAIVDAFLKELTPAMPVIFINAIPVDRQETKNVYECPVYKTRMRGPTYVWTFNLKTKEKPTKWVLASVCLLLNV